MRVDLVASDLEDVARCARDENVGSEDLPERDDGVLERRRRGLRRLGAVELVHELLGRDDSSRTKEQCDEQRTLPRPPESDRRPLVPHLERAEDPEIQHRCGGCSTPQRAASLIAG